MSTHRTRAIATVLYAICLAAYLFVGFQPVDASDYTVSGLLNIPIIKLTSDVTPLKVINGTLPTPDNIVGSFSIHTNKTLLVAHSTTAFQNLFDLTVGNHLAYAHQEYIITKIETFTTDTINMSKLLAKATTPTVILMTCAGQPTGNFDATHRLIITAEKV